MVDTAHLDDFTGRLSMHGWPDRSGSIPTHRRSRAVELRRRHPCPDCPGVPSRSVCDAPHRSKPRWRRRTGASPEGKYLVDIGTPVDPEARPSTRPAGTVREANDRGKIPPPASTASPIRFVWVTDRCSSSSRPRWGETGSTVLGGSRSESGASRFSHQLM